jgi:hypothetical protein
MTSNHCECVKCKECGGTGYVWYSFSGKYMGNHRCDDLDQMECCDECGGEGTTDLCDECRDEKANEEDKYMRELEERGDRYE